VLVEWSEKVLMKYEWNFIDPYIEQGMACSLVTGHRYSQKQDPQLAVILTGRNNTLLGGYRT
jgi:hypothetical protein